MSEEITITIHIEEDQKTESFDKEWWTSLSDDEKVSALQDKAHSCLNWHYSED